MIVFSTCFKYLARWSPCLLFPVPVQHHQLALSTSHLQPIDPSNHFQHAGHCWRWPLTFYSYFIPLSFYSGLIHAVVFLSPWKNSKYNHNGLSCIYYSRLERYYDWLNRASSLITMLCGHRISSGSWNWLWQLPYTVDLMLHNFVPKSNFFSFFFRNSHCCPSSAKEGETGSRGEDHQDAIRSIGKPKIIGWPENPKLKGAYLPEQLEPRY